MILEVVGEVGALGGEWDGVFAQGAGVQSGRAWFAATEAAGMEAGARAHWVCLREGGVAAGLVAMRRGPGARMGSLTSPYTVLFQPMLAAGVDARAAGRALGEHLRGWGVVVLDAVDPGWEGLAPLLAGLRKAGLVGVRFEQFGNWHEGVGGVGWEAYLAGRPGALRETIRRRGRAAAKEGVRFEVVRGRAGLEAGLGAYEAVYERSWKVAEPYPRFNAALLEAMAGIGAMRLGVMWRGEVPVAAQYWTVWDGVATVLKLAHDDAAKSLSPGTLLTAHMIRGLLAEGVSELDFGRGDDGYKRDWAGVRRQRIGVMLANPKRLRGMAALGRHWAGMATRGMRERMGRRAAG